MFDIALTLHILLCIFLIGLVLLQQGKGADAGATFGGSSATMFGAAGATSLLSKLTTVCAILFMITSVILVKTYPSKVETLVDREELIDAQAVRDIIAKEGDLNEQSKNVGAVEGNTSKNDVKNSGAKE